jgi:hypothetical protein
MKRRLLGIHGGVIPHRSPLSIPAKPKEVQADHPQIVCLDAHRVLAITGGETFIALIVEGLIVER